MRIELAGTLEAEMAERVATIGDDHAILNVSVSNVLTDGSHADNAFNGLTIWRGI
jgi:hypothetical protein